MFCKHKNIETHYDKNQAALLLSIHRALFWFIISYHFILFLLLPFRRISSPHLIERPCDKVGHIVSKQAESVSSRYDPWEWYHDHKGRRTLNFIADKVAKHIQPSVNKKNKLVGATTLHQLRLRTPPSWTRSG